MMNLTRWNVLLFLGALLALCFFFYLLSSVPSQPITQQFLSQQRIYAYRDWQSTGYWVSQGERYTIEAEGEWMYSPVAGYNGPEGHRRFYSPSFYPLPDVPGGALIGRIGDDGQPFYVGSRTGGRGMSDTDPLRESGQGRASTGTLYLRIDDDRLGDNKGYVTVRITVVKEAD